MDGYYADEKTDIPEGSIKYYGDMEQPTDSIFFKTGLLKARYSFYTNGQIKNYILFADSSHIAEQGGYTENGQRIANYIVWQPATYIDGTNGWQKYINRKTNHHAPGGYMAGMMNGSVDISFTIDTTGAVTNAAIIKKSGFIDLDQRALAIIEKSPKWIPAIINNQPVNSVQKQSFLFANNEVAVQDGKTIDIAGSLLNRIIFFK